MKVVKENIYRLSHRENFLISILDKATYHFDNRKQPSLLTFGREWEQKYFQLSKVGMKDEIIPILRFQTVYPIKGKVKKTKKAPNFPYIFKFPKLA